MKRRQSEAPTATPGGIPPELLAGPCVEAWVPADEERPEDALFGEPTWRLVLAKHRFHDAREAWARKHGLTDRQMFRLMPDRAPYSVPAVPNHN